VNVLVNDVIAISPGHLIVTTTERDALSPKTTGMEVYNTTTGSYQRYDGTNWGTSRPFATAVGFLYGGASATVVTFPTNRFTVAPLVLLTNVDSTVTPILGAVTTSQFTWTNSVGSNNTMHYIANQMTATSAAG
jgi:hypothetical protein